MSAIKYINISLELWGSLISLIIILCIKLSNDTENISRRPFLSMLWCNIVILLSDAAAWIFKGRMDIISRCIVPISNFIVYAAGYVLLAMFTEYLVCYISTKADISRKYIHWVWGLCSVAVVFVIISQFNHMYYFIDKKNIYQRQNLFWVSQLWGVICMFIDGGILFKYRTVLNRQQVWSLVSYIILPILAMSIQIFMYGIALLYISTTTAIILIYIGIQVEYAKSLKEKELELAEGRIAIMLSQIQPHFLFNTLTAISQLCDIDSHRAKMATVEFAHYLRGNLDSLTQKCLVPFEKELEHIKIYLALEKMRFDDELSITYNLEITSFLLPSLTVQPIIENAVRYGVGKKEEGGNVNISTTETDTEIMIIITDDGVGFDINEKTTNDRTHIGIQNVRSRLKAQCGGTLIIESTIGIGTKAIIKLPK